MSSRSIAFSVLASAAFFTALWSINRGLLPFVWLGVPDALLTAAMVLGICAARGRNALVWALVGFGCVIPLLTVWPERVASFVPVVMNLLVAGVFQTSLRPSSQPLITRIACLVRGEDRLPTELSAYTRRSTLAWSFLFLVLAGIALVLALSIAPGAAVVCANTFNLGLITLFFLGDTAYRNYRYRHYWHPPIGRVIVMLMKHGWRLGAGGLDARQGAHGKPG